MRRPQRHLALVLLAGLAGAAGCVREADPFDLDSDDVAVHLVLTAGETEVAALLTRSGDAANSIPVGDAEIRLIAGPDTTPLVFDADRGCGFSGGNPAFGGVPCYFGTPAAPIQAGATYGLEIVLADGGVVTGATTVPQRAEIESPAPDTPVVVQCGSPESCFGQYVPDPPYLIPVGTVAVTWDLPPGAAGSGVTLAVRPLQAFRNGVAYSSGTCHLGFTFGGFATAADSALWEISGISCSQPLAEARFDSVHAEVIVAVTDPGYHRYIVALSEGQTVRASSISEGLDGAWGVFGAVAPTARPFTIVRSPPPAP